MLNIQNKYTFSGLSVDFFAGLTVAVMLIPQGMAYAMLAGIPPIYGLYAGLVPLLIYPFFGTSPYLSVGPVALVSIIVLEGLSKLAAPMSPEFIQLAILTSMIAGMIQLVLWIFRMGFLVNFLSHPVISGFTSAAAFIIGLHQIKYILGVEASRSSIVEAISDLFSNLPLLNPFTLMIGLGSLILIVILKKWKKSIPGALLAVIFGIVLVMILGWTDTDIALVGTIPSGLPQFEIPLFSMDAIKKVFPLALIICLISFIESLAIAKTLAAKNGRYDIEPNKELLGLGLAKIIGALFQAYPNTGSFTRSAINEQAGAKTGMSSVFAALIIGITLLFFTTFFYYLPKAVLAAIVLSAVFGLIDYKEATRLFKSDKRDFIVLILTFVLTLLLGVQQGVFAGIILSLLLMIQKVSKPHYAILGKMPITGVYRNINRYAEAVLIDDFMVFRYDDDIFFGNAGHFLNSVVFECKKRPKIKCIVLDMSSVGQVDSTGKHYLERMNDVMRGKDVIVKIAGLKGPLRDYFEKNDIYKLFGISNFHVNIDSAINDYGTE